MFFNSSFDTPWTSNALVHVDKTFDTDMPPYDYHNMLAHGKSLASLIYSEFNAGVCYKFTSTAYWEAIVLNSNSTFSLILHSDLIAT